MTGFRVVIGDTEATSEGVERHATYSKARKSALRSAVNILLERRSSTAPLVAKCVVTNEQSGTTREFTVQIVVSGDKLNHLAGHG